MWILEYGKKFNKQDEFFDDIEKAKKALNEDRKNGFDGFIWLDEDLK